MKSLVPGLLVMWLATISPIGAVVRTQASGAACTGTLDGQKFAHLIPEQFAWKAIFQRVVVGSKPPRAEFALDSRAMRVLEEEASAALKRATAIEAARLPSPDLQNDRDEEAAEAVLRGRDNLIRLLSRKDFESVQTWVETNKRSSTYAFPVAGKVEVQPEQSLCLVSVRGAQFPHLILEAYYWQAFFRAKVAALESSRNADGTPAESHIRAIQQHHARIPARDVRILLEIAQETMNEIAALERSAQQQVSEIPEIAETLPQETAQVVLSARAQLIRRLPDASWRAIRQDAGQEQRASTATFLVSM